MKVGLTAVATLGLALWLWPSESLDSADAPTFETAHIEAPLDEHAPIATPLDASRQPIASDARATSAPLTAAPPLDATPPLPGELTGIVLDDGRPYGGQGRVALLSGARVPNANLAAHREQLATARDRRTCELESARFHFEQVAPKIHTLRLEIPDHDFGAFLTMPATTGIAIELHIGTAAFRGHVWDAEGHPVAGALVSAAHRSTTSRVVYTTSCAVSGDDGAYTLTRLAAGAFSMSATRAARDGARAIDAHAGAEVARGETKTFDFGRSTPLPHWRGTLRSASGREHRGSAVIELVAPERSRQAWTCDAGGRFDVRAEPGTYAVRVKLSPISDSALDAGTIEIADADLEHDLVLPGLCIRGRVVADETGAPVKLETNRELSVSARSPDCTNGNCISSTDVEADGSFSLEGLAPGRYFVATWPQHIARLDQGRLVVDLVLGQPDLELELRVVTR